MLWDRGDRAASQGMHLGVEGGAQLRQGVKAVMWGRSGEAAQWVVLLVRAPLCQQPEWVAAARR